MAPLTLPIFTLLAAAAVIPSSATTSNHLRGVSPSLVSKYTPIPKSDPPKWKCLNSEKEIPFTAINDDFCDCEDGSDEPGTSACPNGRFHCANEGHIGATISSTRVNDGLCEPECCDGSDEPAGVCQNNCKVIGDEYRVKAEADRKLRSTGSKIRSSYIAFAKKEQKRLQESIVQLKKEVEQRKAEERQMKDILERTEALDEAALNIKKQSPLYEHLTAQSDLLNHLITKQSDLQSRIDALEKILEELKTGFNPNYQDMAVLEAVRGWEGLSKKPEETSETSDGENKPEGEASEAKSEEEEAWPDHKIHELKDRDPVTLLLQHEQHISGKIEGDVKSLLFSVEAYLPDVFLPMYQTVRGSVESALSAIGLHTPKSSEPSSETTAAREAHTQASTMLRTTETSLKADEDALSRLFSIEGFGRRGEWRKLDGLCLEKDTGEYTYSVCLFGSATQKSNNGGMSQNLGRFSSWNTSATPGEFSYYGRQVYDSGTRCWNGPERSVKLDLTCGLENAILTIAEPEKCEYLITGTSPALCWPDEDHAHAAAAHAKDEL